MKKIVLLLVLLGVLFFASTKTALAADPCNGTYFDEQNTPIEDFIYTSVQKINYKIKIKNPVLATTYKIKICNRSFGASQEWPGACDIKDARVDTSGILTGPPLDMISSMEQPSPHLDITVIDKTIASTICTESFLFKEVPTPTPSIPSKRITCDLDIDPKSKIEYGTPISIIGKVAVFGINNYTLMALNEGSKWCSVPDCGRNAYIHISGPNTEKDFYPKLGVKKDGTTDRSSFIADIKYGYEPGDYTATALIHARDDDWWVDFVSTDCSPLKFNVPNGIISPTPTPTITHTPTPTPHPTRPAECYGKDAQIAAADGDCSGDYLGCPWCDKFRPTPTKRPEIPVPTLTELCNQLTTNNDYRAICKACLDQKGKLWTALGCVPINLSGFLSEIVFKTGVGIAGGVAFLYFLYGAFMMLTSTGNAEKLEEAKQIITSALAGLILIIFSIFLLKTIGVDILQIPGFK